MDIENTKKRILSYLEDHPDAQTDELHRALNIDIDELLKALKELEEEGKIAGEPVKFTEKEMEQIMRLYVESKGDWSRFRTKLKLRGISEKEASKYIKEYAKNLEQKEETLKCGGMVFQALFIFVFGIAIATLSRMAYPVLVWIIGILFFSIITYEIQKTIYIVKNFIKTVKEVEKC